MIAIFIIPWFFISLLFSETTGVLHQPQWSLLKNALLKILPSYEVTFMIHGIANAPKEVFEIMNQIQDNHATLIYDLPVLPPTLQERLFSIACRGNFFIIFHRPGHQFFSMFAIYMQTWNQMCGDKPRPKILIFLHGYNENNIYCRQYFELLWKEFYLDVTILNILNSSKIIIYQYNPFTSIYSKEILGPRTILFPDKISNLSGKKLSVVFFNHACTLIHVSKSGKMKLKAGLCAGIINTLSEVMNFTMKITLYKMTSEGLIYIPMNMLNGTDDFCAFLSRQTNFFQYMKLFSLEQSMFLDTRTEYMIVPIKRKSLISFPINFVAFLAASFILVFLAYLWARIAKFELNYWYPYNTWDCLMGISGRLPVTHAERTLFIAILILSVTHIGDLFQECTTVNIIEIDTIKMDTFEDLDKSGLIPAFKGSFFDHLHNRVSKTIESLVSKSESGPLTRCYDKFVLRGDVTCMVQPYVKDDMIEIFRRSNDLPLIKTLSDDSITMHWMVFPQRKNSPYVNQFNKIIQPLIEHGLTAFWRGTQLAKQVKSLKDRHLTFKKQNLVKLSDKSSNNSPSTSLIYQILLIFITGNILAVLAFLSEIIINKILMRNAVVPF